MNYIRTNVQRPKLQIIIDFMKANSTEPKPVKDWLDMLSKAYPNIVFYGADISNAKKTEPNIENLVISVKKRRNNMMFDLDKGNIAISKILAMYPFEQRKILIKFQSDKLAMQEQLQNSN